MNLLRSTFIALSERPRLRAFAEQTALGHKLSSRFVAGTSMAEAIAAAQKLNAVGIAVTLDALGENVTDEAQASRAAATYRALLDEIGRLRLNANVSLKLTQMGMDLPGSVAERIVADLARQATAIDSFVRVDMEGSAYTQSTIDLVRRVHSLPEQRNIGIVLQSYLRRTQADMIALLADGIRIRLCKGAYQEPPEIAFPDKAEVDANYIDLMKELLASGFYHGLATHDEAMIEQAKSFAAAKGIAPSAFEFQMLYGIRRDLQEQLVSQGYRVRVYVPFGKEWYPYFMRRLAERPANALFILKNLFR
jgi:proline dehydrogenase